MSSKPLSPSRTREILAELEHRPNKHLGQNFLIDGNIVGKSCRMADIQSGDTVIEIGPGLGTLTQALLKAGAEVFAIEADTVLENYLERILLLKYRDKLHLMRADAVDNPLAGFKLNAEAGQEKDFKIVSNLPYAISSPWLKRVLEGALPSSMTLMLQQETADRYAAEPGTKNFGAITVFLHSAYVVEQRHKVSRQCFYPIPSVDSVLLKLVRRENPFLFSEKSVVKIRSFFTQRRKQIGALCRKEPELAPWLDYLEKSGISKKSRPENIPLTAWKKLNEFSS